MSVELESEKDDIYEISADDEVLDATRIQMVLGSLEKSLVDLILKDLNIIALFLFLFGRIMDGVDGIIANKTKITEFGGFIDIVFDFISYSLVPLAFILKDNSNAIFGSILLTTFFGTSSTFFGIEIYEKNKFIKRNNEKSFFHVGGFMGGTITIFFLSLMFLFTEKFNLIALIFSILCILGTIERIFYAYIILDSD